MKVLFNFQNENICYEETGLALGNFDGLHIGHIALINTLISECNFLISVLIHMCMFSYFYMAWVLDKCNEDDPKTEAGPIVSSLNSIAGWDIDEALYANEYIPDQFLYALMAILLTSDMNYLEWSETGPITLQQVFSFLDKDVTVSEGAGNGGPTSTIIYRLREGVERFLITDINNPGASAQAQTTVWVMFDILSTNPSDFNHIPGGANVLYMDGHVEFVKYPSQNAPVSRTAATAMGVAKIAGS